MRYTNDWPFKLQHLFILTTKSQSEIFLKHNKKIEINEKSKY